MARSGLLLLIAVAASFCLGSAQAGAQTDSMVIASDVTYRVDIAGDQVIVDGTYELHNNSAPQDLGDGRTRHRYFTNFRFVKPNSARDLVVAIDDVPVEAALQKLEHYELAELVLPTELRYGDTVVVTVSYVIPDSGSGGHWGAAQISDEYLELTVWAHGSPGRSTVSVILPLGYDVDLVGELDAFAETTQYGTTVLTASGIADAGAFTGRVLAYNEDIKLENTSMTIHSGTAVVLSRPSDTRWRDFVIDSLQNDLPVLEQLIGIPWPHGNIVVEQSNEPRRDGFGGWYDTSDNTIKFERASRDVLLHEFSHGWFNSRFTRERWINEGLAEELASRTIEARGGPRPDPDWPDPSDSTRVALGDWIRPNTVTNDAQRQVENYHYNASWWLFRQITDDIGIDGLSDVLIGFDAVPGQTDRNWRTLFERLDETAIDDQKLDTLFGTYVAGPGINVFQQRRAVLESYDQAFVGTGFDPPPVVTENMRAWKWSTIRPLVDDFVVFVPHMTELREHAVASSIDITYFERLVRAAEDGVELDRISGFITRDIEAMNQLEQDRSAVLETALEHGVTIEFRRAALGIAERDLDSAAQTLERIVASRAALTADAAHVGVTIDFSNGARLDEADAETAALALRLAMFIERRQAIDDRMSQLGLDVAANPQPVPLRLAFERLNNQASAVSALADAEPEIQELSADARARLIDKQGAGPWLEARRITIDELTAPTDPQTSEAIASAHASPPSSRPGDLVLASVDQAAGRRNAMVPAVLAVLVLALGVAAAAVFVDRRSAAGQVTRPKKVRSAPTTTEPVREPQ